MQVSVSFTVKVISSHDSTVCGLNCRSYKDIECHISCMLFAKAQITEISAVFWLRNRKARVVVYQNCILKPCGRVRWVHLQSFIFWQCLVKCCHSQMIIGSVLICKEDISVIELFVSKVNNVFPLQPGVAQRMGRDIALLFHYRSTRGGEWSAARPGCTLPPGKTRYPFYRRLGGPQGRSWWAEKLAPTGFRARTVQPVVSR